MKGFFFSPQTSDFLKPVGNEFAFLETCKQQVRDEARLQGCIWASAWDAGLRPGKQRTLSRVRTMAGGFGNRRGWNSLGAGSEAAGEERGASTQRAETLGTPGARGADLRRKGSRGLLPTPLRAPRSTAGHWAPRLHQAHSRAPPKRGSTIAPELPVRPAGRGGPWGQQRFRVLGAPFSPSCLCFIG